MDNKDKLSIVVYENADREYPVGIKQTEQVTGINYFVPAMTSNAYNNLYGRIMTLVEATTDESKIKSVKTLFQRELNDYFESLERNVQEIDKDHTDGRGYYYKNVYVYGNEKYNGGRVITGESSLEI